MALKACSATQITALLNYNFVRSGSVLYRRHSEISPKDRAVSPDASITWRATRNRQLISRGLLRQSSSKPGAGQEVPPKQSEVCSPSTFAPVWALSHVGAEVEVYCDTDLIGMVQ